MAIQYSGGSLVNFTWSPVTRADLVTNIRDQLLAAGWTIATGSGTDVTMQSATTAAGLKMRVRLFDPGTGNCAQVFLVGPTGSPQSQNLFIVPGGGLWRIVANKYHFFAFLAGTNGGTARSIIIGGVLFTPTWFTFVPNDSASFLIGTGVTDIDVTANHHTWRRSLRPGGTTLTDYARWSAIYGTTLINNAGNVVVDGALSMCIFEGGSATEDQLWRWEDQTLFDYEPIVGWATGGASTGECRAKGQLYDAMIISGAWTSETIITFDGHNWISITEGFAVSKSQQATLFLAIS